MRKTKNFGNYDDGLVQALLLLTEDFLENNDKERLFELWKEELAKGEQPIWRAFIDKVVEPVLWMGEEGENFILKIANTMFLEVPVITGHIRDEFLAEVTEIYLNRKSSEIS